MSPKELHAHPFSSIEMTYPGICPAILTPVLLCYLCWTNGMLSVSVVAMQEASTGSPRALTCYWPWAASSPCYFPVVGSALRWDPALCKVVSACRLSLCLPPSCNVCLILLSDCKVLFCRIQMTPRALSENMLELPGSITKQQKSAADRWQIWQVLFKLDSVLSSCV